MIGKGTGFTGWMTEITIRAVICIAGNPGMFGISLSLIMFVAVEAAEILVRRWVGMTRVTIIPFFIMSP